jgi:hypothetical protein
LEQQKITVTSDVIVLNFQQQQIQVPSMAAWLFDAYNSFALLHKT